MAFNFIFAIFHCKYFSHLLTFFSVREKMNPFTLRFVESDCEFQVKKNFHYLFEELHGRKAYVTFDAIWTSPSVLHRETRWRSVTAMDSGWRGLGSRPGRLIVLHSWAKHFTFTTSLSLSPLRSTTEYWPEDRLREGREGAEWGGGG